MIRVLVAGGLAVVLVLLGVGVFELERSGLHAEEQRRQVDVRALVDREAHSAAAGDDPSSLAQTVAATPFARGQPQRNQQLLARFGISLYGERNRTVALYDPAGHVTATFPSALAPPVGDLDGAWLAALGGRPAISPVFVFEGVPMRATVAPVGGTHPWAVLVAVSPDRLGQARVLGYRTISGKSGGLSDVDSAGTAIASFDPGLVGKRLVDPARLAGMRPGATRMWTVGTGGGQVTYVAGRQPATGYATVFLQRSADLYADPRAQQGHRDVTLVAVLGACLVGLVGFGLALQRSLVRRRARTNALLAGTGDLVLVAARGDADPPAPRGPTWLRRERARGPKANGPRRLTDARLTYIGAASVTLLGRDPRELLGTPLVDLAHPEDVARLRALLAEPSGTALGVRLRTASPGAPTSDERSDADTYRWFDIEVTDLTRAPAIGRILVTCHEIGERKELEDRLAHQALHDPLTGLANRAAFGAALDTAVLDATATGASVAVLFVDLDRFKPVNDTYGHETGDVVLRVVGRRISEAVRRGDVVGRLGGDEFVAVLPGADETVAAGVAARVVRVVGEPVAAGGRQVRVGASVGIAVADVTDEATVGLARHPAYLLRAADDAMYRAKAGGGEQWALAELALAGAAPAAGVFGALSVSPFSVPPSISSPGRPAGSSGPERPGPGPSPTGPGPSGPSPPAPPGLDDRRPDWPPPERAQAHQGRRSGRRRGTTWRSWAVVVAAAILMGTVFAVASALENAAGHRAEQTQLRELLGSIYRSAQFSARTQEFKDSASAVRWRLDGSDADQAAMRGVAVQTGGPTIAALFAPDGHLIATYPRSAAGALSVDPASVPFRTALGGAVGNAPMAFIAGAYRISYLVPVQRGGATAAVLVLAVDTANSIGQRTLESAASATGSAGLSSVDVLGQAIASWDRNLIGRRIVDPAALRSVPDGRAVQIDHDGPGTLTLAARTQTLRNGAYLVRQLSTSQAYAGLRPAHLARDTLLFSMIAVTLAILALVTIWRERALARNGERLSALLHNAHDIVVVLDRDGEVAFVSSAVVRLLGYSPGFWLGAPMDAAVHPADSARLGEDLKREIAATSRDSAPGGPRTARSWFGRAARRLRRTGRPRRPGTTAGTVTPDVRIRGADGAYRWFDVRIRNLLDDRDVRGVLTTSHEITDRKRLQDQLARQAHYDPLTGLPNRAELNRRLTAAGDRARTTPGTEQPAPTPRFSVLFVDLDHFKAINDTFGHRTGDLVLQVVADRISGLCRDEDGVFRLGGDEFVVVLDGADETVARGTARRVLAALREPIRIEDHVVVVGATVGVALSTRDIHGEQVLRHADRAMYQAKQGGRGAIGIHTPPPG